MVLSVFLIPQIHLRTPCFKPFLLRVGEAQVQDVFSNTQTHI